MWYHSVDVTQEGHVADAIFNSACMNYLSCLLICHSVKSLTYKDRRTFAE
jgi:hypothetical protein